MSSVTIVPTGTANMASVRAAFTRLGFVARLASGPEDITYDEPVVVPGVGRFGAAAKAVDVLEMREALVARVVAGKPTLAVCVGMQLLAIASTESPNESGLGVLDTGFSRFTGNIDVPQLGWNQVTPQPGCRFVTDGWAYFANSYRMTSIPDGWSGATTDHGGQFVSALERDDVLACQFHPELSGKWGATLLSRWLTTTGASG